MSYKPNRGGHAPGHLRESFIDWVEADDDSKNTIVVGYAEEAKPIRWLLGQLWNCSDILPSTVCESLDMSLGSTYARAVRRVAQELS